MLCASMYTPLKLHASDSDGNSSDVELKDSSFETDAEEEKRGESFQIKDQIFSLASALTSDFDLDAPHDVESLRKEHGWNEFVAKNPHIVFQLLSSVRWICGLTKWYPQLKRSISFNGCYSCNLLTKQEIKTSPE